MSLLKDLSARFGFKKIIIVPSKFPPGKSAEANYEQRLGWVKKIFTEKIFEISEFEKKSNQTIFAKDIFFHLSVLYPGARFSWILGEDQWDQLDYWKEVQTYGDLLEWIVLGRRHSRSSDSGLLSRRIRNRSCAYRWARIRPEPLISSTKIRKCIEQSKTKSTAMGWIPKSIRKEVIETYHRKKEVI